MPTKLIDHSNNVREAFGNYILDNGRQMGESVERQAGAIGGDSETSPDTERAAFCKAWPKMLEAGFQVLCRSGRVDDCSEGDKSLVVEIWESMDRVRCQELEVPLLY